MVGLSSDRIGTDEGEAVYATTSKRFELLGIPFSPYGGVAFGGSDDRWRIVGGLNYELFERVSVTHVWDGVNLHFTLDVPWRRHVLGMMVAEQENDYFLGVTYRLRF